MNLEQYLGEVKVTWNSINSFNMQLCNASLGLSEFGEFEVEVLNDSDKQIDELGDFAYYTAMMVNLFDKNEQILFLFNTKAAYDLLPKYNLDNNLIKTSIFSLQEIVKKFVFHSKTDEWLESKNDTIVQHLMLCLLYIEAFAFMVQRTSIEEVFDYNINKLRNRHQSGSFNPNY